MASALVGGAFLSAFLQVAFDRMASRPVLDFFRGSRPTELLAKKLETTLLSVDAVITDAETKQFTHSNVRIWLHNIKDAVYHAQNLLDEIATQSFSISEVETSTVAQVQNFISVSLNSFEKVMELQLAEIIDVLEHLVKQTDVLGLRQGVGEKPPPRVPSTSLVEESDVYGRAEDKEAILKLLLSNSSSNPVDVIAIVGMGGIGKTTLAQLVYNDPRVRQEFQLKAWACVSEEFDVFRVTRTILNAVTSSKPDYQDLDSLQVTLKEALKDEKFLIILDDVWNESYIDWDVLRSPFRYGAQGSKIVITTRQERVASIMCTGPSHHLKPILDEECWLLFAKQALFDSRNSISKPKLEEIGRKIVKRCSGLPLAAKVLGGLLRCRTDVEGWDMVLNSEIWELPSCGNDILPALRLSYHYLPSHLKQCFAFSAIFPKDHRFEIEKVVQIWMAEGFLIPRRNRRMEDVGADYIHDLISRSLFQWPLSSVRNSHFVIHDLINDLAKFVSGEACVRLEGGSLDESIGIKTRHMSVIDNCYYDYEEVRASDEAKNLTTFLSFTHSRYHSSYKWGTLVMRDLLPIQGCLRVLCLAFCRKLIVVPDWISSLKHLRYLDMSGMKIRVLPDSVTTMYNLQTLLLTGCHMLTELPVNMQKLVNLRHLDIVGTSIYEAPPHLSRLKDLQTLSIYSVGKHSGSNLRQLGGLQNLRGRLEVLRLQNVVNAIDASNAKMKDKKFLHEVGFGWSPNDTIDDSSKERDVLDKLQPHTNLRVLMIRNYGGTRFPDWFGDCSFSSMISLELTNCNYCCCLPAVGQLPSLKELSITGFYVMESVGAEFYYGASSEQPFQLLEILKFKDMLQWQEWNHICIDGHVAFPSLRELSITTCPKLRGTLPNNLPCIQKLHITGCQKLPVPIIRVRSLRRYGATQWPVHKALMLVDQSHDTQVAEGEEARLA